MLTPLDTPSIEQLQAISCAVKQAFEGMGWSLGWEAVQDHASTQVFHMASNTKACRAASDISAGEWAVLLMSATVMLSLVTQPYVVLTFVLGGEGTGERRVGGRKKQV